MRITTKGQVTIPQAIRERLGLLPNTEVAFELDGNAVRLRRAAKQPSPRLVERLRGSATVKLTTEQILALTRGHK